VPIKNAPLLLGEICRVNPQVRRLARREQKVASALRNLVTLVQPLKAQDLAFSLDVAAEIEKAHTNRRLTSGLHDLARECRLGLQWSGMIEAEGETSTSDEVIDTVLRAWGIVLSERLSGEALAFLAETE